MTNLIGHQWVIDLLHHQQQTKQIPQSVLIVGPPNVGKSTVAKYMMQMLNCQGVNKPCHQCIACRKTLHGNHPDLFLVDRETETLKIETIRTLQRMVSLSPVEGRHRVALLCHFETATNAAANALLKTLEEPPPQVVIILTAADSGILLPTIVSRCQIITLRPLPQAEVAQVLATHWQVETEQAYLLAQLSGGRLGWAIQALQDETLLTRRQEQLTTFVTLLSATRVDRLQAAQQISQQPTTIKEALANWITLARDLMLLHTGSQTSLINIDWQNQLEPLAQHFTIVQLYEMITLLRQALMNLDRNVNSRLNLDVTLLKLPRLSHNRL